MLDAGTVASVVARVDALGAKVLATVDSACAINDPMILGTLRGGRSRLGIIAPIRSDAEQAVALLGTLPQDPTIVRLRDSLRGVADMRSIASVGHGKVDNTVFELTRSLGQLKPWGEIAGLDDATRAAELARIRTTGITDLASDDWLRLAAIIGADGSGTLAPGLPRQLGDAMGFVDLAHSIGSRGPAFTTLESPSNVAYRYFRAWDAAQLAPETRLSEVNRILDADPVGVSRDDWKLLTAILDTDPSALVGTPRVLDGVGDLNAVAHNLGSYSRTPVDDLARWHHLRKLNASAELRDATRTELLDPSIDQFEGAAWAVLDSNRMDLVGMSGAEATRVRARSLMPTNPETAGSWLGDVKSMLGATPVPKELEPVRDSAMAMARRNLDVVNRVTKGTGYQNHPDYAELGRVRSIVRLLDAAATREPAPAATASAAGPADELLRW